jgi:hypothetical protein
VRHRRWWVAQATNVGRRTGPNWLHASIVGARLPPLHTSGRDSRASPSPISCGGWSGKGLPSAHTGMGPHLHGGYSIARRRSNTYEAWVIIFCCCCNVQVLLLSAWILTPSHGLGGDRSWWPWPACVMPQAPVLPLAHHGRLLRPHHVIYMLLGLASLATH